MNIEEILLSVPDYKSFYTVNEMNARCAALAEMHPDAVRVYSIGTSRQGDAITCMQLGHGKKNAVCFACPHPNEPIGAMTTLTLAGILAENPTLLDELDTTWYLIPCIDPDATRLNEGWFKGPFNIENYARGFYRPAGSEQVEWTFPIDYHGRRFDKPIPETRALMNLIERTKPRFVYSLHNSAFGGAYWYVSKDIPALNPLLENAAERQSIALHLGEAEAFYSVKYSGAVFSMLSLKRCYDVIDGKAGRQPEPQELTCGTCSHDFIEEVCDCLTLMAELPYFNDPKIADTSPSDMTRAEAIRAKRAARAPIYDFLASQYDKVGALFGGDNPFPRLVRDCMAGFSSPRHEEELTGPDYERMATVAEKFDNLFLAVYFDILNVALTLRACDLELARGERFGGTELESLKEVRTACDAELSCLCRELEANSDYDVIEIRRLVSVQLESALQAILFS
jgi:hypothetical protein